MGKYEACFIVESDGSGGDGRILQPNMPHKQRENEWRAQRQP